MHEKILEVGSRQTRCRQRVHVRVRAERRKGQQRMLVGRPARE
jgi:hypothetical protein